MEPAENKPPLFGSGTDTAHACYLKTRNSHSIFYNVALRA
jgi:hypothetical protein